jgi:tetratricopeptide (TPR) repeat protein
MTLAKLEAVRLRFFLALLPICFLFDACTPSALDDPDFVSSPLLQTNLVSRAKFEFERFDKQVAELERKQDWAGLMQLAREQLKREPGNTDWEVIVGYCLLQQKNYREAAAVLSDVTQRNPEDIDGWDLLGESWRLAGEPIRALRALQYGATINRTWHATYYFLGNTYADVGRPDLAITAYREALRLEPEFSPSWYGLGTVYLKTGQRDELRAVIEELKKLSPGLANELAKESQ